MSRLPKRRAIVSEMPVGCLYTYRPIKNPPFKSLPFKMFLPHEAQCLKSHSQTLQRIKERGGFGPCEAVAVLEDRKWSSMEPESAFKRLAELLEQWKKGNGETK